MSGDRTDSYFMRRALALARRGIPGVSPNPPVGAVIVREGKIVGTGYHRKAGEAHAEVLAISEAGESARGATIYVSLEPCNHHGKTPPCTEAILSSGLSRVVFSVSDPNPNVSGGGRQRLLAAGLSVLSGCEQELGEKLIRPWKCRVSQGRIFRVLVAGRSMDGRFFKSSTEWIEILSPGAKRLLKRQEQEYRTEAEFLIVEEKSIGELLSGADRIFLYVLPVFLGESGVGLSQDLRPVIPSEAQISPHIPGMLHLLEVRKLGQTIFAEYEGR